MFSEVQLLRLRATLYVIYSLKNYATVETHSYFSLLSEISNFVY